MTRTNYSLTLALCASFALHALLIGMAAEHYTRYTRGHLYLPGFVRLNLDSPTPGDTDDPWRRLGESAGTGDAIMGMSGELPMQATQWKQAQPFASLDPAGMGEVGVEPTESTLPEAPAPSAPPAPAIAVFSATPAQAAPPVGLQESLTDQQGPYIAAKPIPAQPAADPAPPLAEQLAAAVPVASAPQQPSPPAPEALAAASADPAPKTDSEIDPTTTIGTANFRYGSTDVRIGRRHKLTRPRLTLAAKADLVTRSAASVILLLRISATGQVTSAEIYRSSGSTSVDQPVKIAAYDWWFEPLKNEHGQPIEDVITFTVSF